MILPAVGIMYVNECRPMNRIVGWSIAEGQDKPIPILPTGIYTGNEYNLIESIPQQQVSKVTEMLAEHYLLGDIKKAAYDGGEAGSLEALEAR